MHFFCENVLQCHSDEVVVVVVIENVLVYLIATDIRIERKVSSDRPTKHGNIWASVRINRLRLFVQAVTSSRRPRVLELGTRNRDTPTYERTIRATANQTCGRLRTAVVVVVFAAVVGSSLTVAPG